MQKKEEKKEERRKVKRGKVEMGHAEAIGLCFPLCSVSRSHPDATWMAVREPQPRDLVVIVK